MPGSTLAEAILRLRESVFEIVNTISNIHAIEVRAAVNIARYILTDAYEIKSQIDDGGPFGRYGYIGNCSIGVILFGKRSVIFTSDQGELV